ncbi:MAG: prepilin-type N-terminal cleavage/methylation domain-containing protein [Candidatus Omnitrophica bacterium]|nr:prepilin-type N-terminal cleavage/methylation domain-containing protein [Candidatus Omnitrophota bacterium]
MKMKNKGFTLLELMITAAILVIAITGLLALFTGLSSLNQNSKNITLAMIACQDKMEEIRDSDFSTLYVNYNGANFDPAGFPTADAEGAISINNTDPDLLEVCAAVSWRERSNRIIGEDVNLNGSLDGGEDLNGDNRLSSPAEIVTLIGER